MKVLIVDDDDGLRAGLARFLASSDVETEEAATAQQADLMVRTMNFSAIILDLGLPDQDGMSLLREWQRRKLSTPVIVLSARGTQDERADGIEAGADDYLAKPYHARELLSRLMRRVYGRASFDEAIPLGKSGEVSFRLADQEVMMGSATVEISATHRKVLGELIAEQGRFVSKAVLLDRVSHLDDCATENSVEQWVRRIRKALGSDIIETEKGRGYRIRLYER